MSVNGVFQFRGGTAAEWTSANPTLAAREIGIETDSHKFKIGDGLTSWNSLAYGGIKGDTGSQGPSGSTQYSVALNFGSTPMYSNTFSWSDSNATTSNKIIIVPAPDSDEYEMDSFNCSAYCPVDGTITAYIVATPGPVTGIRNFNYVLGQ